MEQKKIYEEDVENVIKIANSSIHEIITKLDPIKYKPDDDFILIALAAPILISVSIIDKIARMLCLKHEEVLKLFIMKVRGTLELQLIENEKLKAAH